MLTTRIAWLIQSGQVDPPGILAVTFTNKAAGDARPPRRCCQHPRHVDRHLPRPGNRLLRAHHRDAGLPQPSRSSIRATSSPIKRLLKTLNVDDEKFRRASSSTSSTARRKPASARRLVEAWDDYPSARASFTRRYEAQCQREAVVDFAELLLRSYELLERNEPLRRHYQRRFRHILVDEFQDTNRLQYRWLKLLRRRGREAAAMFCVGDDDQSIYRFRGAEVGNMRDFERDFRVPST